MTREIFDMTEHAAQELVLWCDNTRHLYRQHRELEHQCATALLYDSWSLEMFKIQLRGLAFSCVADYMRRFGDDGRQFNAPARELFASVMYDRFLDSWRAKIWGDFEDDTARKLQSLPAYVRDRVFGAERKRQGGTR